MGSRVALVPPCICFLRRRVGQRFFLSPAGLTLKILSTAPRGLVQQAPQTRNTQSSRSAARNLSGAG